MSRDSNQTTADKDTRLSALQKIWSYATGMLALAVIFTPVRHSTVISVAIVSGAAVSSGIVWTKGDRSSPNSLAANQVKQLEQRISDLEAIAIDRHLNSHSRFDQVGAGENRD